jgi:hypothetical protein
MILKIGLAKHDVRNLAEARAVYIKYRDAQMMAGKGVRSSHYGKISVNNTNYEITWNGAVWRLGAREQDRRVVPNDTLEQIKEA